jgi:uncharacterized membrane protein
LRRIGTPIAVALFIWSFFSVLSIAFNTKDFGFAAVLMALAIYIFVKIFGLEKPFTSVGRDINLALERGRYIQIFSTFLALIIAGYGFFIRGIIELQGRDLSDAEFFIRLTENSLLYILSGILIYGIGKALDLYYRKGLAWRPLPSITLSIFAIYFIFSAILKLVNHLILEIPPVLQQEDYTQLLLLVLIGFAFLIFTIWIHFYIKERYITRPTKAGWRR